MNLTTSKLHSFSRIVWQQLPLNLRRTPLTLTLRSSTRPALRKLMAPMAAKGADTEESAHRSSKILFVPKRFVS